LKESRICQDVQPNGQLFKCSIVQSSETCVLSEVAHWSQMEWPQRKT
jgi:hypothetical protein